MENKAIKISVVIIGYNSLTTLKKNLSALNNVDDSSANIEIIYIDDGSIDESYEYFKNYQLNFIKKNYKFKKNSGRNAARNKGVELASNDWILFINSNIVVQKDIINNYCLSLSKIKKNIFVGKIIYESNDKVYEKYLNDKKRGINSYSNNSIINFQNLLLSNCLINKDFLNQIPLSTDLKSYGGEELEWSFRVINNFPNSMFSSTKSIARRINHPSYKLQLSKMIEFGENNLGKLDKELQVKVVKWEVLLKSRGLLKHLTNLCLWLCIKFYRLPLLQKKIIQLGYLTAILKGYYNNIKKS